MKEIVFLNRNANDWKEFEALLVSKSDNIDKLGDLYIQLNNDLSYAKTFYPNSKLTAYLNDLTIRAHQKIYRTKKERKGRVLQFWREEFPLAIYKTRKYFIYSLLITIISTSIGWLSSANDETFVRLIMGDAYVNMTEASIAKGDPMAVYKSADEMSMFLGITLNNIKVSFIAFILGVLFSIGTGYILFTNGIMLGAFHYLMFKNGVLLHSMSVIWLHGTIEIFAIIVAGSAGILIGNSFLFPGTYKRAVSFTNGAKLATKIIVGLIPFFIIAGFIEGFITRYSNMPIYIKIFIIGGSATLIVWYFFIYPIRINKKN
jgi:uncharacterized membrane protein SpoIIM required for sporulation